MYILTERLAMRLTEPRGIPEPARVSNQISLLDGVARSREESGLHPTLDNEKVKT